jgi:hypothetical protein
MKLQVMNQELKVLSLTPTFLLHYTSEVVSNEENEEEIYYESIK